MRSPFFSEQSAHAGNVTSIRQGETAAALLTMAVGGAASAMTGSPLPVIGAAVVSALMIGGYEYSMAHPASDAASAPDAAPNLWRSL